MTKLLKALAVVSLVLAFATPVAAGSPQQQAVEPDGELLIDKIAVQRNRLAVQRTVENDVVAGIRLLNGLAEGKQSVHRVDDIKFRRNTKCAQDHTRFEGFGEKVPPRSFTIS